MAYPTIVGTETGTGTGSVTVAVPAGTADNDLLLAFLAADGLNSNFYTPAGWTLVENPDAFYAEGRVFSRVASSEPASYTFNYSNTLEECHGGIVAVRGGTVVNASGVENHTGNATITNAPSVTTDQNECLVFRFMLTDGAPTITTGPSITTLWSYQNTVTSVVGWETQAAAGATGAATWEHTTEQGAGCTVAVQPNISAPRRSTAVGLYSAVETTGVVRRSTSVGAYVAIGQGAFRRSTAAGVYVAVDLAPSAPTVEAYGVAGDMILVSWQPIADAVSYQVDWSTDGSAWTTLGTTTDLAMHHAGRKQNVGVYYRVRARNAYAMGHWSDPVIAWPLYGNDHTYLLVRGRYTPDHYFYHAYWPVAGYYEVRDPADYVYAAGLTAGTLYGVLVELEENARSYRINRSVMYNYLGETIQYIGAGYWTWRGRFRFTSRQEMQFLFSLYQQRVFWFQDTTNDGPGLVQVLWRGNFAPAYLTPDQSQGYISFSMESL